jgi:squalene-hopene cyclase
MIDERLTHSIESATEALLARQRADGHWVFELEADATIPAEYVLLRHYLGEPVDAALEQKIAVYLRRIQGAHGGWPLFADGEVDVSATVKAYFALKMIGEPIDADHMRRAREAVLARGGAARANVFTRIMLALFGFIPWRAVPVMPVEIMLLPKWFPFHLDKISYWSRTVIVPLLVLMAKKPRARNSKGVRIDELFLEPPHTIGPAPKAPQQKASWFWFFRGVDNVLRATEPYFPRRTRQRAVDRAVAWVSERLNGEDGLGAIFPAMANSVMMFDVLGYPESHPQRAIARKSIEKLLAVHEHEAYCQPCVSPIWDTGLVCHALLEVGGERANANVKRGLDWLVPKQILDVRGDWIARRPDLRPGGWAFQYANPHYPDVDDTAVVAMAMDRVQNLSGGEDFSASLVRAKEWILGMQSANGAWGAFDADNEFYYLNNIPFADHGALSVDAGAIRRDGGEQSGGRARHRLSAPHPACRRKLVRPLGHELHLRHLVGVVRAQRRRRRSRRAGNAQSARLADRHPERRRRLGRGRLKLQARLQRLRARAEYRVTDRLGAARPDGLRRRRSSGSGARHRLSHRAAGRRRLLERAALHRDGFPARVLSALPRLCEILPTVGAGALPQSQERQCAGGGVRDVARSPR